MVTIAEMKKYALDHGVFLHPKKNIKQHINWVNKHGFCPCSPIRKSCPCDFVVSDMEEFGNCCKCTMFVNEAYLKEFGYTIEEAKAHTALTPEEEKELKEHATKEQPVGDSGKNNC